LMLEHTEDPGVEHSPGGYVFTEGEMVPEFYEGTIALSENEVSEVIESSFGYHIIKRLPLDVEADFEANYDNILTAYMYQTEQAVVEELKASAGVQINNDLLKAFPVR